MYAPGPGDEDLRDVWDVWSLVVFGGDVFSFFQL